MRWLCARAAARRLLLSGKQQGPAPAPRRRGKVHTWSADSSDPAAFRAAVLSMKREG